MRAKAVSLIVGLAGFGTAAVSQPLSAIDWLTDSVAEPAVVQEQAPTILDATPGAVQVRPIGGPSIDGIGLITAKDAALSRDLWGPSDVSTLTLLVAQDHVDALPATRELFRRVLLVSANPPETRLEEGTLFRARVDKLLAIGALDDAAKLLERTDLTDPRLFRRWFDTRLLLGTEDAACARLAETPGLSPTFPTRIFCLARGGDWTAAALSLDTAEVLDVITPREDALLLRFLDQTTAEEFGALDPPKRVTPLDYRLHEAVGEPIPTDDLPLAFAHADLRPLNGWKAQITAAERLVRGGVVDPKILFGLYRQRKPSASGGIWDRVGAMQTLDRALSSDAHDINNALTSAWKAATAAEIEVPFSEIYAGRLKGHSLDGLAATIADQMRFLANQPPDFDEAADPFLAALSYEKPLPNPTSSQSQIILRAFSKGPLPREFQILIREGRQGEAILRATQLISEGATGDTEDFILGLKLLRELGLEEAARRTAMQFLILERNG